MYSQTKRNALLAVTLVFAFVLACNSLSDKTSEANKLVAEGNTAIDEGNKLATDASAKNEKVFNEVINYDMDKEKLSGTAKEAVDGMTKSAEKFREASKKFDEASKLKIGDKFKEYLTLKAQEFTKRAEQMDAAKKDPQAFIDSTDVVSMNTKIQANKLELKRLDKEAKDLEAKAEKIRSENKEMIK